MENIKSATVMEISTKAFKQNIQNIQKIVGKDKTLIPVVKANAYGTYLNKNMELMNNFKILAVARAEEGVDIRKNGYKKEIVIIFYYFYLLINKLFVRAFTTYHLKEHWIMCSAYKSI